MFGVALTNFIYEVNQVMKLAEKIIFRACMANFFSYYPNWRIALDTVSRSYVATSIKPEKISQMPFIVLELLTKNNWHSKPNHRGGHDEPQKKLL